METFFNIEILRRFYANLITALVYQCNTIEIIGQRILHDRIGSRISAGCFQCTMAGVTANSDQLKSPNSIAAWVKAIFEELHNPEVFEVALTPGVGVAIVECRGLLGSIRWRKLPAPFVAGVVAKMKKLANLDVAERSREQFGRVRLLDFHGGPALFEVMTVPAENGETVTLRRL